MSSPTRWTFASIVILGCAKQTVAVDAPESDAGFAGASLGASSFAASGETWRAASSLMAFAFDAFTPSAVRTASAMSARETPSFRAAA